MRWRSGRGDDRGTSAVEFALIMVPLIYLVLGIIQYGWYFHAMQAGTSATSDTVRRLSVGDCQDATQRNALLTSKLGSARQATTTVQSTVAYTDAAAGHASMPAPGIVGGGVTLTVEFKTADFNFPLIPVPDDGSVTRTVFARVEDTTPSSGGCS